MRLHYALLVFLSIAFWSSELSAQCPVPNNNFQKFGEFNLTPSGVGDTVRSFTSWGGDYHHIDVDSGKTYVISMCETFYGGPQSNYFIGAPGIYYDPIITLYQDTQGVAGTFNQLSGHIVGVNDDFCGVLPQITYTSDFTGKLAAAIDPAIDCDSFAIDSAIVFVTEILLGITAITSVDSNVSCTGFSDGGASVSVTANLGPVTYLWETGGTTASINGLSAGTYSVIVTDSAGNADTTDVTITEPPPLLGAAVVDSNITCNSFLNGGATASGSGGTSPFSYLWSNSAITASITGVGAGTYSVTITDANGCTDSASVTITEPTAIVASVVLDSNDAGNGGGATASGSGGTSGYSYTWSNSATTASITGVSAGTYSVTITDANGCTDSASVVIVAGPAVSVVIDSNVSCNSFIDGGATASASGGTAPYTYMWSNTASTASITGVGAGTYTVTVTDNNGLTAVGSNTVTEPAVLVAASVIDSNVSCNSLLDGGATASATGGTMPYSYSWSNSAITASITGVAAGTYSVTITDNNGCTDSTSIILTEPAALVASTVEDSMATCNSCTDGGATASAVGGAMPYNYNWSNSATTASITGVVAGTYSVTITDANGCTDSASVVINAGPVPVAVVDSNISCNSFTDGGASTTLSGGTAPYSYLWSSGETTTFISGVAAGTYTVTVTDNNGLTGTSSVSITEPATLVSATTLDSNVSCNSFLDGGATASATGGTMPYDYSWSNSAITASITGVAAGTYSVTITDANGCSDSASVTITQPDSIIFTLTSLTDVSCAGEVDGSFTFSITGGTPFSTAGGNYLISPPGFPVGAVDTATGIAADTIAFLVTDSNQCFSDTVTVIMSEPDTLVAAVSVDSNVSCNTFTDGGATASATGGTMPYSYNWSNGATTASITGLVAGTYTVTVTDANGCSDVSSTTITEPTVLVSSAVVDSNVTCNSFLDGGATSSATGGTTPYAYAWSNGASTSSATALAAGTYSVTITDANGCEDSSSVVITEPTPLVASSTLDSNVTCFGFSNGGATASATGGTGAYSYAWSNSAITASITGVTAGTYSVTITDANGCTDSASTSVSEPALLVGTATSPNFIGGDNISCNGATDGSVNLSVTGGTTTYSYSWTGPNSFVSTNQNLSSLEPGAYDVVITDANGCTASESITLTEPAAVSASFVNSSTSGGDNISCNNAMDGTTDLTAAGGHPGYTYSWTGPNSYTATNPNLSALDAGTYVVVITDTNGCTATDSTELTQPDSLITSTSSPTVIGGFNISCFNGADGSINLSPTGGSPNYSYSWTGPNAYTSTTGSPSGLSTGSYHVTVTDVNGCTALDSIFLNEPAEPLAVGLMPVDYIGGTQISCFGFADGTINLSDSGGTPGYAYAWTSSNGFTSSMASISGLTAGTYTVVVTDTNGCSETQMATLTEPTSALSLSFSAQTYTGNVNILCNGTATGSITLTELGDGEPGFTYNWTGPNGYTSGDQSPGSLFAGAYQVTLTDANGCVAVDSITLTEPTAITVSIDSINDVTCDGDMDGLIFGSSAGGIEPRLFTWDNGSNTNGAANISQGNFGVTVTDGQGCTVTTSALVGFTFPLPVIDLGPDVLTDSNAVLLIAPAGFDVYEWDNGSNSIERVVFQSGTYELFVTDSNGCINSDTVNVSLWPTGVQEISAMQSVKVYPNPAREVLNLELMQTPKNPISWTLMNSQGQQVRIGNTAAAKTQINLADLAGGIYLLRLDSEQGTAVTRLIIQ